MFRVLLLAVAAVSAFAREPGFRFEANLGQADRPVRYIARAKGGAVWFTDRAIRFPAATLHFGRANSSAAWEAAEPLASTSSYFLGADPSRWIRNAPNYGRLLRRNVYPGIDVVWYGDGDRLEFDFMLAPHADAGRIRLAWTAGARLSIGGSGELLVESAGKKLSLHRPVATQVIAGRKVEVPARFAVSNAEARFVLGSYDAEYPLTIDPTVETWSFAGGNSTDRITVVAQGVVAGVTTSAGLAGLSVPTGKDIFLWSQQGYVVFGGSGDEEPTAAAHVGNATLLAGWTSSRDLPLVSPGGVQRTFGGGERDGFYLVNPGQSYGYSSYLGGSGDDAILAVAADPNKQTLDFSGFYLAGETNSPDFPVRSAVQPMIGGGKDGFLTHISSGGLLADSTYWGGSGDDAILAVDATTIACWFGGRTNSPELFMRSPLQAKLAGGTDGFLARLDLTGEPAIGFASFFGGSADDEVRALHIAPDGWVWAGGNTTSADLPVTQAYQPGFGGETDAWIGRFGAGNGAPSFVTYLGGSGHDELAAIAHDANGDLYLAGWTNSRDLAVVDALQDRPGGGDDGLLARMDRNGVPQMLTYVGGTGNDRLRSVAVTFEQRILAGGESDSPAIPALEMQPKAAAAGQVDGLYLQLHQDGIYVSDLVLGKDLTATLNVTVVSDMTGLPVTVRSSDPSLVSVRNGLLATGASVEVTGNASAGQAELIVSAPSLPARHVIVTLRPSYLVNSYREEIPLRVDNTTFLTFATATTRAESGEIIYQKARTDMDSGISYRTDQPEVIQVRAATDPNAISASVRAVAEGAATISIVSARFPVLGSPEIRVKAMRSIPPVLAIRDAAVGRNLQTALPLNLAPGSEFREPFQVRLTSEDPLKLVLSASAADRGSGALTFTYAQNSFGQAPVVWAQGRASSGVVRVRAEVDGAAPVYANIFLGPSIIALATPPQSLNIGLGQVIRDLAVTTAELDAWSTRAVFAVYAAINGSVPAGFTAGEQFPSPESANQFTVTSSDPAVVSGNFGGPIADLGNPRCCFGFNAGLGREGTAELSLAAPGFDTTPPVLVTVRPRRLPLSVTETVLGKDLEAFIGFRTPYDFPNGVTATVTSSDASKLLVSQSQFDEAAKVSVRLTPGSSFQGDGFWISALADSGDVTVTIDAPGYQSRSLLVHLAPTTYRLTPPSLTVTLGDFVRVGIVPTFPGAQPDFSRLVRAAAKATFALTSSDPILVQVRTPTVTFSGYSPSLEATAVNLGVAELRLTAVSGATVDPAFARATVTIVPNKFSLPENTIVLGKNLQRSLFGDGRGPNVPGKVTVQSLDPARLLLSRDPLAAGVRELDTSGQIYVQALADSGEAYLAVSVAGYEDARVRVLFYPTAFGFFDAFTNPARLTGRVGSTFDLRIVPVPIDPVSGNPLGIPGLSLRGGLDAFEVRIATSDGNVGRIFSPLGFTGGMNSNSTQFRADANGVTELSVVAPDGFVDGDVALRRRIEIAAPKLSMADVTMGKDMQYYQVVAAPADIPVVVTSSDPTRVLVSASSTTVGQASATVSATSSSGGAFVFVQALQSSGDVTLTATAAGYETAASNVHLEPSYFAFNRDAFGSSFPDSSTYKATFTKTIYFTHPSYVYPSNKFLRPGIGPVTVPVTSSDNSIATIASPVVFQAGYDSVSATIAAGELGTATLQIDAPPGFATGPDKDRSAVVNVRPRSFSFGGTDVGKDRVVPLGYVSNINYVTDVHIVSSDPGSVLLSLDPNAAGAAELTFRPDPANGSQVYAHGLSDSGTPEVTASATGFEMARIPVRLHPSGYGFGTNALSLIVGQSVTVRVATSDGRPLRPGAAPVTVGIENTNATVATAGTVTFQPGDVAKDLTITAKASGTAVFTIRNTAAFIAYSGASNLVVTIPAR